jgi:hypothetical protein
MTRTRTRMMQAQVAGDVRKPLTEPCRSRPIGSSRSSMRPKVWMRLSAFRIVAPMPRAEIVLLIVRTDRVRPRFPRSCLDRTACDSMALLPNLTGHDADGPKRDTLRTALLAQGLDTVSRIAIDEDTGAPMPD